MVKKYFVNNITTMNLIVFFAMSLISCKKDYKFEVKNQTNYLIDKIVFDIYYDKKELQLLPGEAKTFSLQYKTTIGDFLVSDGTLNIYIMAYTDTASHILEVDKVQIHGTGTRNLSKKSTNIITIKENSNSSSIYDKFMIEINK